MPHTTHHNTTPYLAHVAQALCTYAQQSSEFSAILRAHMQPFVAFDEGIPPSEVQVTPALVPHSTEQAVRKLHWLLGAYHEHGTSGARTALDVLVGWAHAREQVEPKSFLLGLDMGVVPIGIWGKMKIKREPMALLLRADQAETYTTDTVRTMTMLTHAVVEQGLIAAGGHTGKLEPELGDWLFGDKHLALYRAPHAALTEIAEYLEHRQIPVSSTNDHAGIVALALSPAVYLFDLPQGESLQPIAVRESH